MEYPLHTDSLNTMDIEAARKLMKPQVRDRFDEVRKLINEPPVTEYHLPESHEFTLSRQVVQTLVKDGILQKVTEHELYRNPTKGCIKPFTTVEHRTQGPRRRFICWPERQNAAVQEVYQPDLKINQPSTYIPRIQYSGAVKRDLKCGFFQIDIPLYARPFYRFKYEGTVYQMSRMPMGHMCAPELQHILTSVLSGHPDFVASPYPQEGCVGCLPGWVSMVRIASRTKGLRSLGRTSS